MPENLREPLRNGPPLRRLSLADIIRPLRSTLTKMRESRRHRVVKAARSTQTSPPREANGAALERRHPSAGFGHDEAPPRCPRPSDRFPEPSIRPPPPNRGRSPRPETTYRARLTDERGEESDDSSTRACTS